MTHTKTPWFLGANAEVHDENNLTIAEVYAYNSEGDEYDQAAAEANAAFICRAANSHERMREALEMARARIVSDWKSEFQCRGDPDEPRDDETLKQIDAALAAAKGE